MRVHSTTTVLKEFMNARDVDILSLAVEELNIILKDFYTNVKSKTGEPYKKNSLLNIYTISLVNFIKF
jgi:hypothetical protein